ncbi:MAG: formate dehydrogenase accessory sulfurtransferase FdhD [Acidobacteriota bacterium]|nr:formate dehydrogenase accessory sulfurtransferase FdhD [Acidobacteriota bacterium]
MSTPDHSQARRRVERVAEGSRTSLDDRVAIEEPMEIRVDHAIDGKRVAKSLSITMRTPGHDFELAAGFLYTEGILRQPGDIETIEFCGPAVEGRDTSNIVKVTVADHVALDLERLQRNFYATSSCGICGKASLDAIAVQGIEKPTAQWTLTTARVHELPKILRANQPVFETTGGLHASALVSADGVVECVREDVGRHNAVDKLIGSRLLRSQTPIDDRVLVLSGRAGFELIQKAVVAGIAIVVAIGAPSSLAVELAESYDMTLVGFASHDRFNIYSGGHRIGS